MVATSTIPFACFLSLIRPPGIQFENALLQIAPLDKGKCPFMRDNSDVVFQLYTRHNPTVAHSLLIDDDEGLFASNLDLNDNTIIYFHAFMETPDDGSGLLIRQAYTHRGDTNVIMVDAQRLEAGPWYFKAAENTWYIGRLAAQFIDYLVSRGLNLSKTHLIGHSLGAQAAGVAGSSIKSGRVSRITGLDPALPLFNKLPKTQRLDPSDAEFVDVIHTDAGIFGYNEQVGHVDFYPNGGISPQPGCELEVVIPQQQFLPKFFCSHWRSYMFYSESVLRPNSFVSTRCQSWRDYSKGYCSKDTTHMGFGVDFNTQHGLFFPGDNNTALGHYYYHLQVRKSNFELSKGTPLRQLLFPKNIGRNHRQRRFIQTQNTNDNMLVKTLKFLFRHRNKVVPILTVIREMNTIIQNGDSFINHSIKEENEYTENYPVILKPINYNIEINNESKLKAFFKKLFGLRQNTLSIVSQ